MEIYGRSGSDVQCISGLGGNIISDLWDWVMDHIPLHGIRGGSICAKTFNVYHMLLFLSVKPVFHQHCVFFFTFYFLSEGIFNIYSIKAKRAVNRMHCVVQIVIGGFFKNVSQRVHCRDIKAMQKAFLSYQFVCHKWVCDIGKPFISNKSTEKIMEGRQWKIRDGNDFRVGFNSSTKKEADIKTN